MEMHQPERNKSFWFSVFNWNMVVTGQKSRDRLDVAKQTPRHEQEKQHALPAHHWWLLRRGLINKTGHTLFSRPRNQGSGNLSFLSDVTQLDSNWSLNSDLIPSPFACLPAPCMWSCHWASPYRDLLHARNCSRSWGHSTRPSNQSFYSEGVYVLEKSNR
jgi:hypothetical protein